MLSSLRLLVGTLTVLPVRPPARVDRAVAGTAMALAPLAGLMLAVGTGVPLGVAVAVEVPLAPAALGFGVVGLLALLTRGMHLDGLADTVDGLGSGRSGEAALTVMRKSDIGAFGVVALVVALGLQAVLVGQATGRGAEAAAYLLALALVTSRGALSILCTPVFRSARPDGLGATVAGSVAGVRLVLGLALLVAGWVAVPGVGAARGVFDAGTAAALAGTAPLALLPALLLAGRAVRRFGGVTGDVYGAALEVTFTGALLLAVLATA